MIKTEAINDSIRVYSTDSKMIKHIPTNQVHSEYVIKKYIDGDYVEIK